MLNRVPEGQIRKMADFCIERPDMGFRVNHYSLVFAHSGLNDVHKVFCSAQSVWQGQGSQIMGNVSKTRNTYVIGVNYYKNTAGKAYKSGDKGVADRVCVVCKNKIACPLIVFCKGAAVYDFMAVFKL